MNFEEMSPSEITEAFKKLEDTNFEQAQKIEELEATIETLNGVISNAKTGKESLVGKTFTIGRKTYIAKRDRVQFMGENKVYPIEDVVKDEALVAKLLAVKGQKVLIEAV